ncbi:K02A2.6-like, partial [Cordylochernes scorpioides]
MNMNACNLFAEYKQWMESYAIFEIASGISKKSDEIKRATLLHCLGPNVQRIFFNLPDEKENYEQTKMALDKYFTPHKNVVTERFKFSQRVQKDDESIDNYLISLRELSKSCEFGNLEADMIRDQIIEKCNNKKLKEKLLQQENLTLSKTIDIARMLEISRKEIRLLEPQNDQTLNRVQNKPKKHYNANNFNKGRFTNQGTPSFSGASKPKCYRCGLDTHSAQECGAKKMTCSYCNKLGHLFRACRNRPNQNNNRNHKSFNQTKVKTIQEENKTEVGESSDEYTYYTGAGNKEKVQIDGSEINMIIDTGSDRTFISYNKMLELYGHKIMPKLHDTTRTFFAYGQDRPLPCYGYFNAVISWKENSVSEEIYVIDKKVDSLLGGKASFELGIIKRVNHVNESMSTNIETLVQEHEHLFHGLGTIKGYSHKVTLKDNYRPIAQRCRRIPYAMVEAVNQELDKMLENGIIEEVHQGSEWVSNIIVVPKRDSEEIRLCIDLREVNKVILRERHPIPTIDNMLHALKGAKVFAKLDAKKGFWQVDLDPQSRPLTTFITHRGCYRFCKVPFGLSSAPEAYQKGMDSILLDLKGVICYLDDVVVYAKNRQELEERLRKVLQRFDKVGIRLNRNKCKFAMEELDILGHIVGSEGIKPDNRKIKAVLNFPIPKNIEMLRSFLGTCGFLRKFIPNFSKLAEPLNNLTRKNVRWNWDLKKNKAFQDLKESLTKEPCLAYYNLNSPTELITDASPIGLGAVLIQTQQNGIKRPIAYASRSLTDTEKRYSQIEKETLGCVWAIEHFNTYIWGRKFVLKTDHKPLIYMLNPKNGAVLPPIIQRLSWRLQPYDFEIEFIQGKQNIADIFSRQPLSNTSDEKWLEDYVHKVLSITSEELQALSLKEIKVCTEQDPVFQKLKEMVQKGVWPYPLNEEFKCFYKFKDELSIFDNLILKGSRILLPSKLIKRVLRIAHETHQGMTRTKQLLREKYFWINMDFDIENLIRNCPICVRNQPLINDQPLQIVPLPSKPWMKLGIDIVGPIGHHYVLTVIDYYSSYPEAMIIEDISSKTIIKKLMEIFARHGYPHEVVTDNGLQFVSTSMEKFLKECGIRHIKASPYYLKSNGKIERFHRFLKKQFNSSSEEGKDWKEDLSRILMSYRTTPNRSTGKTPAFLLFSREIKTKLSSLVNDAEEDESNIKEFNMVYKEKMKTYNDIIRKASPHNFEIGNLVYVANPNNGKLDSNFRSEHHVILENPSINSFKLVNTKNGKIIHRNAKHLKHVPTQETNQGISDLIPEESQENLSSDSTRIEHLNSFDANCNDSHVLLATAGIKIKNGLGKLCTCRALLDSGSQVTMITKGCYERLGLVQRKSDRMIIGVGNTPVQHSSSTVSVTFCPLNNSEEFSVEAVVTGVLTSEIPNFRLKDPNWTTLKNLKLADPEFYIQAPIDMILGADIYTELMLNGPISLGEGLPMAINTRLGWVLLGKLMGTSESNTEVCNLSLQSEPELEFVMKRFWETESVPSPDLCTQDEDCESLFSNNHGRDSHGRYLVKLPFRQHRPLLGESREKALRRFLLLERKLCKNVKLYDQYRGFMKEYEHLNHMERVPIAEVKRELCRCYYMPHHPVIREQSTTTKMRVVFDASAKSENNVSLNQFLHKGPKIQQDVFFILLRFRTYPVAITADIEKMYHQIRIHPEDADYQRILWRPSPEEPVVDYRLLTVTYGTTLAPFLAMRTLQQLAEDEGQNYPEASRVTLNDFYVDDLLTGAQTIAETKELIDQLKDLMKKGGFHLRKWNSNCHEIVSHVEEINEEKKINLEKGAISKILGIVWDHVQDTFRVNIILPEEVVTKRDLLSNIARIFDPIGFLSPTTVALKIIMQELWRGGTGWDEHIPNDIKEKTYLWSDSQISLSWIKSDPNRWKTFIHNRVVKIQQLSDRNSWRHVSGKDNPADCASRGIMPAALSGHTLWWQGPTWLKDNNFVQNQDNCYGRECHEEEKQLEDDELNDEVENCIDKCIRLKCELDLRHNGQETSEKKGSEKPLADFLSRFPNPEKGEKEEEMGEILLIENSILDYVLVSYKTQEDPTLRKLYKLVKYDRYDVDSEVDIKPYNRIKNEITIVRNCLFFGNRMIIPDSLREYVLKIIHENHIGVNKMKTLARSSVYWPGMDEQIEKLSKSCSTCMENTSKLPKQEFTEWTPPNKVWKRIHLDYFYFAGKTFLILVDAHSNWIECQMVPNTSAGFCIDFLRECLARYGIPEVA